MSSRPFPSSSPAVCQARGREAQEKRRTAAQERKDLLTSILMSLCPAPLLPLEGGPLFHAIAEMTTYTEAEIADVARTLGLWSCSPVQVREAARVREYGEEEMPEGED